MNLLADLICGSGEKDEKIPVLNLFPEPISAMKGEKQSSAEENIIHINLTG